jgi:sulfur carrier protein
MVIVVNGRPTDLPDGASVAELIKTLDLERQACAVEVNRELVPKRKHAEHRLSSGDQVEVVSLVGGG